MFKLFFLCGFLFTQFAFAVEPQSGSLTLREVYEQAKAKTEALPQSQSQLREYEARKDQVLGRFLPNLSLGANYQKQDRAAGLNSDEQTTSRLILTQSLYEGGRDKADYNAAKSLMSAQKNYVTAAENNLFSDVARSFFSVLAAEQDIRNIQKSIDLTQNRVGELNKRMKVGKTQNVEVLAADAQLAVLKAQLLGAQGNLNVARDTFARVSGLDRTTPLTDPMRFPSEPKPIESYLAEIENRPDIQALKLTTEASEYQIRAAKAGHLPTLLLSGNRYLSQSRVSGTNKHDWDVNVSLSFPIFSGGIVNARVREIKENELQAELQLKNQRRIAEEQIRQAYSTLLSSLEQVKALEAARAATDANYKEQVKNYRFSLTTNLDVIQALNSLQDTNRTLDKTRFDALIAWAQLRTAIGNVQLRTTK